MKKKELRSILSILRCGVIVLASRKFSLSETKEEVKKKKIRKYTRREECFSGLEGTRSVAVIN